MKPFSLNTGNEEFARRQKSVFDQLTALENSHSNNVETPMETSSQQAVTSNPRPSRKEMRPYRGKESIFKKPREPPLTKNFIKQMPDFKRNPHKWIKYSLDDVKDEDMSDRSNTKAALSFLDELKNRNKKDEEMEEKTKPQKIVFTPKPPKPSIVEGNDEEKATFRSSKVVMPEYVVGQKTKKEKKNKATKEANKEGRKKELKLDHLIDEDE